MALLGSFLFFWIAPATVGGGVPWLLTRWQSLPPLFDGAASRWIGGVLVAAGTAMVVECFARFAFKGIGTPAPVAPTRHLVVSGLYRHLRNPMYVGVVLTILGQALWLGSVTLLAYAAVVWAAFFVFVLAYEEPALARQFGAEYEAYRAAVPRWLPRLAPWRGS
jgi:protein-S-isoprenylcysteine O-methyltransferase Ste14